MSTQLANLNIKVNCGVAVSSYDIGQPPFIRIPYPRSDRIPLHKKMLQSSSCLPLESARYSTCLRDSSALNPDSFKDKSLNTFASSRQTCPLRAGIRHWSNWPNNGTPASSSPASIATDNSSEIEFSSNVSPLLSASENPCRQTTDAHGELQPRDLTVSQSYLTSTNATSGVAQDGLKALPSRPKAAPILPKNRQWHCTVEENRPVHANRLQNRAVNFNSGSQQPVVVEVDAARSRCRPRRRPCSEAYSVVPPKLRRDTDCTEAIVRLIVFFSTKLVHTIWSQTTVTPKSSKDFNGAGVLPLQVFIQETLRRSKTSYSTLQVALFYLILLRPHVKPCHGAQQQYTPGCRALQCGRRMFLTALILASKYLQDRNYSARAWSKISGLPVSEINENERQYLELIKYNLHMTKETFESWSRVVLTICKTSGQGPLGGNKPDSPPASPEGMAYKADFERPGSPSWWSHNLLRLTPDVVKDPKLTEEYLATLTSGASLVDSGILLDTPPSSPESFQDVVSDHNSPLVVPSAGPGPALSFAQGTEVCQSPAILGAVPTRPLPPNLPTPQTTPRYDSASMFSRRPSHSDLRCRASLQALNGVEKQALTAANLETCPPPRPRRCMNASSATSDAASTSWMSSPESSISDFSSSATRSRSSSISSTTSIWSLPASCSKPNENQRVSIPRGNLQVKDQVPKMACSANVGAYSFYHSVKPSISGLGESRRRDRASTSSETEGATRSTLVSQAKSNDLDEGQVAQLLASLSSESDEQVERCAGPAATAQRIDSARTQNNIGPGKKHKRNRSSAGNDILHDEIRQFIWSQQYPVYVEDDKKPTTHVETSDKQAQYPSQKWALPRKPVPNALHNKRMALHHSSSPEQRQASELAADFLRRDVTVM